MRKLRKMGQWGVCNTEMDVEFWWKHLKRDHLEDLGMDDRILI
jgi:hypothetical protein